MKMKIQYLGKSKPLGKSVNRYLPTYIWLDINENIQSDRNSFKYRLIYLLQLVNCIGSLSKHRLVILKMNRKYASSINFFSDEKSLEKQCFVCGSSSSRFCNAINYKEMPLTRPNRLEEQLQLQRCSDRYNLRTHM